MAVMTFDRVHGCDRWRDARLIWRAQKYGVAWVWNITGIKWYGCTRFGLAPVWWVRLGPLTIMGEFPENARYRYLFW